MDLRLETGSDCDQLGSIAHQLPQFAGLRRGDPGLGQSAHPQQIGQISGIAYIVFTRRYRNPLTPNGCAKCTCAPQACSTSTAPYQPYVASTPPSGSDPACSSCSPSATGSLTIRTAESCSPDSDWRTITDRRRCRSIPTNCLPSYSSIGASRDSWKVSTPSIRRERHEERRPRPFIASSGLGDLAMCPGGVFAVGGVVA